MHSIAETHVSKRPGRRSTGPSSFFLVLAIITICNVAIAVAEASDDAETVQTTGVDMSDSAHSNKADPDYGVVFPDDQVQVMTIAISPDNWQKMLANMTELYGAFGGGSMGRDAGQGGGAGGIDMSGDIDPVYVPADISFNGMEWPNVGIRFKGFNSLQGSWSEGSYKISLKLNFDKYEDDYPEIKNQRFYGFDELNLQGNYNDDSLMREMVVPSIFRESGVVAPRTAFYRLYVDHGEGPVYFGLYTMVEAVEDTVIETQFADDSGNLYKPEGNGATFAEGTFDPACFEKKTNEDESDYSDVEALYTILNSDIRLSDPEQWRSDLEAVFDVDGFLRWLATNTVIQNWDTYGGNCRNFYLYTDPSDGKITWIPWDNNYALNGGMGGGDTNAGAGDTGEGGQSPLTSSEAVSGTGTVAQIPGISGNETRVSRLNALAFNDISSLTGFSGNALVQSSQDLIAGQQAGRNFGDLGGGNRTPGGMPPGNMTPDDGGAAPGGGMGSTLSLSLEEAGDNWPLIRYLADDPVYYAQYQEYLEMVVTTSFEPSKMEEIYRTCHELIEPYVTGSNGEQAGYTHLDDPEDFDEALDELITHVNSRYDAVMEFLSATPVVTPTLTPAGVKDTTSPVVSITSPASYCLVTPGEELVITWSATDDTGVEGVGIGYSLNRGISWSEIADGLPKEGSYEWTVPEESGSLLTVKVSAEDAAGNTGSASRICRVSSARSLSAGSTLNITAIRESITLPSTVQDYLSSGGSSSDLVDTTIVTAPTISAGTLAKVRASEATLTLDENQAEVSLHQGSAGIVASPCSQPGALLEKGNAGTVPSEKPAIPGTLG